MHGLEGQGLEYEEVKRALENVGRLVAGNRILLSIVDRNLVGSCRMSREGVGGMDPGRGSALYPSNG
jgi:hypothetical protein